MARAHPCDTERPRPPGGGLRAAGAKFAVFICKHADVVLNCRWSSCVGCEFLDSFAGRDHSHKSPQACFAKRFTLGHHHRVGTSGYIGVVEEEAADEKNQ